jgi:hypothetical protein
MSPFQGGDTGSNPVGGTNRIRAGVEESGVLTALSRRRSRDRSPSPAPRSTAAAVGRTGQVGPVDNLICAGQSVFRGCVVTDIPVSGTCPAAHIHTTHHNGSRPYATVMRQPPSRRHGRSTSLAARCTIDDVSRVASRRESDKAGTANSRRSSCPDVKRGSVRAKR